MTKVKRGFVLGKFMPLHQGHLFLFNVANALVDELSVLVCTRDCEPIDGLLRKQWVDDSVHQNIKVLHLHQDIPQAPEEHEDFWNIWRETIVKLHPDPIDTVFGSEDYILRLAKELNAKPFIVDKNRELVPVSATQIRHAPQQFWAAIPPAVRSYYQCRICILGPESTGKTELSQKLAKHFSTIAITEYGRVYDEHYKQGKDWAAEDFVNIIQGHWAISQTLAQQASYLCFEDTDRLQTLVWAEYLLKQPPQQAIKHCSPWQPAHHYLLLKPNVPWRDDGTRYSGDQEVRDWFFEKAQYHLSQNHYSYTIIDETDWCQRLTQAIQATEAAMAAKFEQSE